MEIKDCPNCGKKVDSVWNPNLLISKLETDLINMMLNKDLPGYCNKCSGKLLDEAKEKLNQEIYQLAIYLEEKIHIIPIVTTHSPQRWEFLPISIVTAQSVTGTGFISEFKSSFTDLFGLQSGSFNRKIVEGEVLCFAQLRAKALELNANAIIATDIDYGEVGGGKGMLLVCAAGTAVKVTNPEILGIDIDIFEKLKEASMRLHKLKKYQ